MPRFSDEEKALLAPYVTDAEGDIFAIRGLDGIVGAAYARYSRAPGGFRETLLKEFIREGNLDVGRAGDLIDRVLIAYGDDSVGELEGAHLSLENISILATKEIEDRRIGGSPIEQSTRYVFYDKRGDDGEYRYVRDQEVMASAHADAYVSAMDLIFGTYCDLVEPMKEFYSGLKPLEAAEYAIRPDGAKVRWSDLADDKERKAFRVTYNADIRTKACDALRALLPIATKTNVGIFGNGRFFQHALSHCMGSPLPEVRDIAARAKAALDQVIPKYVKRAKANEYQACTHARMQALAGRLLAGIEPEEAPDVALLDRGEDAIADRLRAGALDASEVRAAIQDEDDVLVFALMLFPYARHPLSQVRRIVRGLSADARREIVVAYVGERKTRRDRPGRAFEGGYPYTFDLCTDFGTYKDLERHRMGTQIRQAFTPTIGFAMPDDLVEAGHADRVDRCVEQAVALYERLKPDFPHAASYATLHGSKVRWVLGMNDRALQHMIELRTTPQGHPSYRRACQAMHRAIEARSSWRAGVMSFADHGDYFWSRADSEARQRQKEAALDGK